jgi:hypothetical protein
MREITLELDAATVEQLDVELDLLGFERRSEYLRWLIDNRASIDQGTEHDRLLHAYADRLDALERRLDALETMENDADPVEPHDSATGAEGPTHAAGEDTAELQIRGSPDSTRTVPGAEADVPSGSGSTATRSEPPTTAAEQTTASRSKTIDADETASTTGPTPDADGRSTEPTAGTSAEESGVTSMNLAPERVSRISEDPIAQDADVLSGVETERLDELTRRAVAKTRDTLDRTVETGLSYRSSTSLADDDVRVGDDITDLDALDLPGRSEETIAPRRTAAGHALAFLRDVGEARRADFVDAIYEEFPAGYDTESGWWNCIKRALKQVDAVEGGEGTRVWRFVG